MECAKAPRALEGAEFVDGREIQMRSGAKDEETRTAPGEKEAPNASALPLARLFEKTEGLSANGEMRAEAAGDFSETRRRSLRGAMKTISVPTHGPVEAISMLTAEPERADDW